jgi:Uma2 family endonuclease
MSQLARRHEYTFREYLELEEVSNTRHEYFDGEIYAMAGGTPEHAALSAAVTIALGTALRGSRYRVFSSDLKVRVRATGFATYPDVTVVCGEPELDPESDTTVVNPIVVVEGLSRSTEVYDRGEKLSQYKQIGSLQECLLVAHDTRRLELHRRGDDRQWIVETAEGDAALSLASLGVQLSVEDVYRDSPVGDA